MMPTVPSARTQSSEKRNFAPALTEKTSSPTSTKPPTAVSIPRKSSTIFFMLQCAEARAPRRPSFAESVFDRLELFEESVELARERGGGLRVAVGARERRIVVVEPARERRRAHRRRYHLGRDAGRLQPFALRVDVLAALSGMRLDEGSRQRPLRRLLREQTPEGRLRAQLARDRLQRLAVERPAPRAGEPVG